MSYYFNHTLLMTLITAGCFGMFIASKFVNKKEMQSNYFFYSLYFFILFFSLPSHEVLGQLPAPKRNIGSEHVKTISFSANSREETIIDVDFKFTAIAFRIHITSKFTDAYIEHNGKKIYLQEDNHGNNLLNHKISELIHFDEQTDHIQLYPGIASRYFEIILINGSYQGARQSTSYKADDCGIPPSVEQNIWRNGLPDPDYTRAFSKVNHVILHHSAGSNTSTDYYQVVRDIYLYHTQGKGWSDIGYNYLIAPDGTIFNGRDPDGGVQDNVKGAHFCGKNTGTMGICLLGTFTSVKPSEEAFSSTLDLATWKLKKEGILATNSFNHEGTMLSALTGHRDGCATECPGSVTYGLLEDFRNDIDTKIENCNKEDPGDVVIYPVPALSSHTITLKANENDTLEILGVYNSLGQEIYPHIYNETPAIVRVYTQNIKAGVYSIFANINASKKLFLRMLILQ